MILLLSECFDDLDYIHRDRASGQTASAAYAAEFAVIIVGKIYELVHESLPETLHMCISGVAVSHLGKVGVHT